MAEPLSSNPLNEWFQQYESARARGVLMTFDEWMVHQLERLTAELANVRHIMDRQAEAQDSLHKCNVQMREERDRLTAERDEWKEEWEGCCKTIRRQAELLTAAVNLLRGDPPEDTLWSHHDIAELVKGVIAERDRLRAALIELRRRNRLAVGGLAIEEGKIIDEALAQDRPKDRPADETMATPGATKSGEASGQQVAEASRPPELPGG